MNQTEKVAAIFSKFPGIGRRQASRFMYFLLAQNNQFIDDFISSINQLRKEMSQCSLCFRFFNFSQNSDICEICSNPNIDTSKIMIVEKDMDLDNINKTGVYNGRFFVLGGILPILENNPNEKIRVTELLDIVKKGSENNLKEIIIALGVNPEGDNTSQYIKKILEKFIENSGIKISVLGRGLSTGTELEYSDSETLTNALKNRS